MHMTLTLGNENKVSVSQQISYRGTHDMRTSETKLASGGMLYITGTDGRDHARGFQDVTPKEPTN